MIKFLLLLMLFVNVAFAGNVTTASIISNTLAALPNCLHYQIKGICYWMTPTGSTVSTPYISHYLPDVVVSIFNPLADKNGGNAWIEMNDTLDQAGKLTEESIIQSLAHVKAGGGQHGFENPLQQNVFFKEADVTGNPALSSLPSTPTLLPTTATPLKPYFQSALDSALWRGFSPQALPEQADAVVADITHYIGVGVANWGGVFPFEGKIETSNDVKAAAVIAQRASNLLTTQNGWAHLYQSLPTSCGIECHAATISENHDQTQFQMVYPIAQNTCGVFGKTASYGEDVASKTNGAYIWVLWRQYEGCVQIPGQFISKTIFGVNV